MKGFLFGASEDEFYRRLDGALVAKTLGTKWVNNLFASNWNHRKKNISPPEKRKLYNSTPYWFFHWREFPYLQPSWNWFWFESVFWQDPAAIAKQITFVYLVGDVFTDSITVNHHLLGEDVLGDFFPSIFHKLIQVGWPKHRFLDVLGPSNGGVWTCTPLLATFEGSGFLGHWCFYFAKKKVTHWNIWWKTRRVVANAFLPMPA